MVGEKDIEVNTKTKEGVKAFLESQRGQKTRINLVVIKMNSHQQARALRPPTILWMKYLPQLGSV